MEETKKYSKSKEVLNQVSWSDLFSQDNYFWLKNSFQYSENINADDELHWIKLAQKIKHNTSSYLADCQLIESGNFVYAFPIKNWWKIRVFNKNNRSSWWIEVSWITLPAAWTVAAWYDISIWFWAMFQWIFWFSIYVWNGTTQANGLYSIVVTSNGQVATGTLYIPYDHPEDTDESISTPASSDPMTSKITYILNFNNTRLIVATWNELRVYYPELDRSNPLSPIYTPWTSGWQTWWKRVQTFWWWMYICWLTSTFEYLKVWVQDHWYNTKVFYYQANNDFRSTFVYNQVDLKNTRVMRVYSINGIDYYTASLDWTDAFVSLNKIIGATPIQIFTRKWWLVSEDIFGKAWYFIWPTALDACYLDWNIYIADSHWIFKFKYNPTWKDPWYLKWKINNTKAAVTWLAICENYIYSSDERWLHQMRLYDTWEDWYETTWILISREMEGEQFQWCFTKMLDEVRLNYELNPILGDSANGKIEVFVSPNNTRTDTNPAWDGSDWWYKVMEVTGANKKTRTQISNVLNNYSTSTSSWLEHETWFEFDRQTITYLIKITKWSNSKATPIVREIQLWYHTKGKANEVYDLKTN